jgi:hypothetical protein
MAARADASESRERAELAEARFSDAREAANVRVAAAESLQTSAVHSAAAATTRALRLEGDSEALRECSLDELRGIVGDIERGRDRAREALRTAEARAAAAAAERLAESSVCCICLDRRKDTALNCGHVLCGTCVSRVRSCPECCRAITARTCLYM